ncbi:MAG TPA: hypothetical protein VMM36_00510 [Opitutaceae bacterium]|nr:hypothetical protein [Opitutaceae bacterium]
MSSVEEIEKAIERLDVREQIRLVRDLPTHLKFSPEDMAAWRVAESGFQFWDNPDDAIYDNL